GLEGVASQDGMRPFGREQILIKILFVCHGNICRSPMAEYMMKDMVRYRQLEEQFYIESAGVASDNVGMEMQEGAKNKLRSVGVPYDNHRTARRMTREDYAGFDYVICMDENNKRELYNLIGGDPEKKIHLLLDFTEREEKNIPDPWFTNDFDDTYDDMLVGISGLLKALREQDGALSRENPAAAPALHTEPGLVSAPRTEPGRAPAPRSLDKMAGCR
ncbi:MAG: low molecular weight phosphotyrosine protein phosphatase, partial [Hornefia butyriciproducens]|nr:low molecular weight phosphotyrosine protein phosphatase [Hornefia butyriciproducens]